MGMRNDGETFSRSLFLLVRLAFSRVHTIRRGLLASTPRATEGLFSDVPVLSIHMSPCFPRALLPDFIGTKS
eukprot:Skav227193  [mRNA]  locus=scaffold2048:173623:174814:+ [translate_table: standard]